MGRPLVPAAGRDGLLPGIRRAGRELNPAPRGSMGTMPGPGDEEGRLAPTEEAEWGGDLRVRPCEALWILSAVNTC